MKQVLFWCFGILLLIPTSCSPKAYLASSAHRESKPVRNVIFVVGDGMGLPQITAGNYANGNRSVFERFPIVGLQKTHSADDLITDSAAGATAFSTGEKTNNGAVAVDANGQPMETLFEEATTRGYSTGVVVNSTITHATPACFYAHEPSRHNYQAIAEDLALSNVDVAIGYGREQFVDRPDGRDLKAVMEDRGVYVSDRLDQVKVKRDRRQMVLLPGVDPPPAAERPFDFLRSASLLALDQLDANRDPFFLVVESSQIDWAGHANDGPWLADEMLDLDRTLQAILDWAEDDGRTLVVVTADHETGGLALTEGNPADFSYSESFSTLHHNATMVPVFARGPSAELFAGMYDNTFIHARLRQAMGWDQE